MNIEYIAAQEKFCAESSDTIEALKAFVESEEGYMIALRELADSISLIIQTTESK